MRYLTDITDMHTSTVCIRCRLHIEVTYFAAHWYFFHMSKGA
jgi:hypothetical protein